MNAISPGATWANAVPALASLPEEHREAHGGANLMAAIKRREAGRRFFEELIVPLLQRGATLVPVLCFVDSAVARDCGLETHRGFSEKMTRFEAGVFVLDGEEVVLEL